MARLLQTQVESLRHVVMTAELQQSAFTWTPGHIRDRDLAFLQYTSGSTGNPKGVMLTHANLLANLRAMGQRIAVNSSDVFVSWLPLYHDMGSVSYTHLDVYKRQGLAPTPEYIPLPVSLISASTGAWAIIASGAI